MLNLTLGFNVLAKGNCKTGRQLLKFSELVRLILEILRYIFTLSRVPWDTYLGQFIYNYFFAARMAIYLDIHHFQPEWQFIYTFTILQPERQWQQTTLFAQKLRRA